LFCGRADADRRRGDLRSGGGGRDRDAALGSDGGADPDLTAGPGVTGLGVTTIERGSVVDGRSSCDGHFVRHVPCAGPPPG
jgi:hypothetical protein